MRCSRASAPSKATTCSTRWPPFCTPNQTGAFCRRRRLRRCDGSCAAAWRRIESAAWQTSPMRGWTSTTRPPNQLVSTVTGRVSRRRSTSIVAVAAATVMVALTVLVLRILSPQPVSQDRTVRRLELNMPAGVEAYVAGQSVALSPDGSSVAILGVLNGVRQIFLRRLDQFEATTPPLRGMAFPLGCFFSPNGRSLACFDAPVRSLKKVSAGGWASRPIGRRCGLDCRWCVGTG